MRVATAQPQAQQRLTVHPTPSKKQPLRGLSPHPQPLSPTRGEGSKTQTTPCDSPPDSTRAPENSRAATPVDRANRARFSPSPAGGRGGRGVRVVTAQTQAQQRLTVRPTPSKKQPLRGLSPHPQPLSPTRGEGSKTQNTTALDSPPDTLHQELPKTRALLPQRIAPIASAAPPHTLPLWIAPIALASPPRPLAGEGAGG